MNSTPEYCLLWINHWSTCMGKSEWASWVQAFGSIAAILATLLLWRHDKSRAKRSAVDLLNQVAVMIEDEMVVAIGVAGGFDMEARKVSGDRLHEQLRILRSLDAGMLDLQNAVLSVSLCATAQSFSNEFDSQNASALVSQPHCKGLLQPMLEVTQATVIAIKRDG